MCSLWWVACWVFGKHVAVAWHRAVPARTKPPERTQAEGQVVTPLLVVQPVVTWNSIMCCASASCSWGGPADTKGEFGLFSLPCLGGAIGHAPPQVVSVA